MVILGAWPIIGLGILLLSSSKETISAYTEDQSCWRGWLKEACVIGIVLQLAAIALPILKLCSIADSGAFVLVPSMLFLALGMITIPCLGSK